MKTTAGVVLRGPGGKMPDILSKLIEMAGYREPSNTDNEPDNGHTGIGRAFPFEIQVEPRSDHLPANTGNR